MLLLLLHVQVNIHWGETYTTRLEPYMLKNLPIIPFRTSQNFYPLFFLFHSITNYSFYSFHHNAGVTIYHLHSRLCLLTVLIEYLTVLLEYIDPFAN